MYKPEARFEAIPASQRQLPSLYLTQVKGKLIDQGAPQNSLVLAYGTDDPDFTTLITRDKGDDVDVYVLARTVSYVYTPDAKTWQWLTRDEFDAHKNSDTNRDAWVVFRYVVAIEGVDEPARWMLTKTGGLSTARPVNTKIDKDLKAGGTGVVPVRLKIEKKFGRVSGEDYSALVVLPTQGTDEGFALAETFLADLDVSHETTAPSTDAPTF
jgi:hypothetical protein